MKKFTSLFALFFCLCVVSAQADVTISGINLASSLDSWGSQQPFTAVSTSTNSWTFEWNLSSTAGDVEFKIVTSDNKWIGYYNGNTVTAPDNWVQSYGNDNNFKLFNSKTGYKKYQITATWTPCDDVYKGWNIVVEGVEHATYSVVGDQSFFSFGWMYPNFAADYDNSYDMEFKSNNNYCEITKTVSNKKGNYEYKIVREHSWSNANYPSSNASFYIPSNDTYEVTFYFNPDEFHVGSKVSLKIVDGNNFIATENFEVAEATYHRELTDNWGTLCLPFAITKAPDGVTFYTLSSVDTERKVLSFKATNSVEAGMPVVFKASGNALEINEGVVPVSATTKTSSTVEGWELNGSFARIDNYSPSGTMYFFSENKFWSGEPAYIPAYRAWFLTNVNFGANPAPFRIEADDTEDLQFVEQEDGTVKAYYDLQGRKLDGARKGLVIENGKIIMVK